MPAGLLELFDVLADTRLGHVQLFRRLGKVSGLDQGFKGVEPKRIKHESRITLITKNYHNKN